MGLDEVGVGIGEVQVVLQLPAFLREAQGLWGQPRQLLAEGEVVPLDIGGVDPPFPTLCSPQGGCPSGHLSRVAKDDGASDSHHAALTAVLNPLGHVISRCFGFGPRFAILSRSQPITF